MENGGGKRRRPSPRPGFLLPVNVGLIVFVRNQFAAGVLASPIRFVRGGPIFDRLDSFALHCLSDQS